MKITNFFVLNMFQYLFHVLVFFRKKKKMILEFFLPFLILFSIFIIQTCLQLIRNINSKKELPNHIRYFKSSEKKLKQDYDAAISKAAKQSKAGKKEQKQLQFSKLKKYLPPQVTPFGDQAISQPNQSQLSAQFTHEAPKETNFAKMPIAPRKAQFSSLLQKIQKEAEKIHDDKKKADKEEKAKEKEEREKRKLEEKEVLKKKQEEEAAAAAAPVKKGLGTGGLASSKPINAKLSLSMPKPK